MLVISLSYPEMIYSTCYLQVWSTHVCDVLCSMNLETCDTVLVKSLGWAEAADLLFHGSLS